MSETNTNTNICGLIKKGKYDNKHVRGDKKGRYKYEYEYSDSNSQIGI